MTTFVSQHSYKLKVGNLVRYGFLIPSCFTNNAFIFFEASNAISFIFGVGGELLVNPVNDITGNVS